MRFKILIISIACVFLSISSGANALRWDTAENRVDADIRTWTVPQVLARIAKSTGWQVLMDPTINNTVPTKFTGRHTGDALQRLLGPLNYAMAPGSNGQQRLFVYRTARSEATQLVAASEAVNGKRIEDELIVMLKPGEKIEDLAKRHGAKVAGRADGQNAYKLKFEDAKAADAARDSLAEDSSVEGAEYNYSVDRPETPQLVDGGARPLGLVPKAVTDGQYVIVGLIDTPVQTKGTPIADFLLPGIAVGESGTADPSTPSHGTSMGDQIMRGVEAVNGRGSTSVRILPVDVYGNSPSTSTFDVATGIYKAVNAGANIVNLSLGSEGDSTFLHNTIIAAQKQGVVFLAAAGNDPTPLPMYPAAYPEVTAVTAGNGRGGVAPYANPSSWVDVIAPGTAVVTYGNGQFQVTGTSVATAGVSGIAAATAERARLSGANVQSAIQSALSPRKAPR